MSHPADANSPLEGIAPPRAHDSRPRVALVAAVALNGVIGAGGGMPWRLPEDLKRFKQITLGHPVIMGRKTWESIGQVLPGRRNIVVTRQAGYDAPGADVVESLEAALALCARQETAFVIGGGELYRDALPLASALILTEIHREYAGDVRFPDFDRSAWQETRREPRVAADGTRFDFVVYERPSASTRRPAPRAAGSR
jgi:dihydrofolate reductase